ncbi:Imm50 family immunity protein [uncultured Shewanella sp.]|uniref:Imm50 family immunity protein n=1 Tax=uncultured Shewanella sp. TaxID=173975 RepID=UPI0026161A87|nr:Imm50 family immunity protein [uncultured Shewanella sp.]
MKWNEFDDTVFINKIFSICPDIGLIDIFDLELIRDAKTLILAFDLVDELPDKPPVKWGTDFNRCRMGINCSVIDKLNIVGWDYNIRAKLTIKKENNLYYVDVEADNVRIEFNCRFLNLTTPSVYLSE